MQLDDNEVLEVHKFIFNKFSGYPDVGIYIGHPYLATKKQLDRYFSSLRPFRGQITAISMLYPERYYGIDGVIEDFMNYPKSFGFNTLIHEMKFVSGWDGELIDWPEDLLNRLLDQDNIVGVKEDSKNDNVTIKLINKYLDEKHIIVAGHGKRRTLKLYEETNGSFGWLNGSSIIAPELGFAFSKALNEHGPSNAFIQTYIKDFEVPFFNVVKKYGWHMAHKYFLSLRGYSVNERFPLPSPSIDETNRSVKGSIELVKDYLNI
jgi:hypothetical protein